MNESQQLMKMWPTLKMIIVFGQLHLIFFSFQRLTFQKEFSYALCDHQKNSI